MSSFKFLERIDIGIVKTRYQKFLAIKKDAVGAGIGIPADVYHNVAADDFISMLKEMTGYPDIDPAISGVKMYFACYDKLTGDNDRIPNGKNKQVSLVFTPTIRQGNFFMQDRRRDDDYYLLTPRKKIHPHDPDSFKAPKLICENWVRLFREKVIPQLPDNDTTAVWYNIGLIREMLDNVIDPSGRAKHQNMVFIFGAYAFGETMPGSVTGNPGGTIPISEQLTGSFVFGSLPQVLRSIGTNPILSFLRYLFSFQSQKQNSNAVNTDPDPDAYDTGIPIPPGSSGGDSLP